MPRFLSKDEALGWTREHGQRLNAGDAAGILWESPYDSAYQLWARKTGKIPKKEQTKEMAAGNMTEPAIFAWYEQYMGVKGGLSQVWAEYDDAPWIQAKSDYWIAENGHLAEFKAPQRDDARDHLLSKAGTVPYHYWLQCQHMMAVFDVGQMNFVSWRAADDHVVLELKRDEGFWATVMLPAYQEFYRRIQEDSWPKPDGKINEEGEEWAMYARRLIEAKEDLRLAEFRLERAEAALKRLADQSGGKSIAGGGVKASWMTYKPRWEVAIKAETKVAFDAIIEAVKPLEKRAGVKEIKPREYPANLVLRIEQG